jgi:uncharacterized protein with beta-barrel porin domain
MRSSGLAVFSRPAWVSPVYRMPLAAHIALIDPGFYFNLSPSTTASVSYSGQFGDNVSDNAVEGRLSWLF